MSAGRMWRRYGQGMYQARVGGLLLRATQTPKGAKHGGYWHWSVGARSGTGYVELGCQFRCSFREAIAGAERFATWLREVTGAEVKP